MDNPKEMDNIYTLISGARYWKEFIPSKLEPLDDEELLLLSEKFYVAIEECNEDLKALDSDLHEALSNEVRKLEQRVAAVDGYYIERGNKEEG